MSSKYLVVLAALPALLLMIYVYKKDKAEKEPIKFLAKLFGLGALTVISAIILEVIAEKIALTFMDENSLAYAAVNAFLCVALVEEGGKYFVLKKGSWKSPEFNFTFDAVVYAVVVSMGFATVENILYVLGDGTVGLAVLRGILSVPGHAIDGVFMGLYYGRAKQLECLGDESGSRKARWKALLSATVIHGFYDFCLMSGEDVFIIAFFVFEIIITVVAFRKVNKLSREDTPLFGSYGGGYGAPDPFDPMGGTYGGSSYGSTYGSDPYGSSDRYGYSRYSSTGTGFDPFGGSPSGGYSGSSDRYGYGPDRYGSGSSGYSGSGYSGSSFDPFGETEKKNKNPFSRF